MSQQVFAQAIDMSPASLSSIFNGRTKPTLNIVEAIKRKFPNVSVDWLMFGTGEMYMDNSNGSAEGNGGDVLGQEPSLNFDTNDSSDSHMMAAEQKRGSGVRSQRTEKDRAGYDRDDVASERGKTILKLSDIHKRKVMEIRVYYDDCTFETFVPSEK